MAIKHKHRKAARGTGGVPRVSLRQRLSELSGPLTFVIVILAAIFAMSVFFRVSDIQIEGNVHYTDEEIIRAINIEPGDNLFMLDRIAAVSRVLAKLPYVEQASVERSLPNKVTISIVESKALAYIPLGEEKWSLDHSCKVLGQATEMEAQFMVSVEGISPGTLFIGEPLKTEDDDQAIVDYLTEILSQMENRGLLSSVKNINFSNPNSVEFSYGGKYTVVLGRNNNIEHKFGMFVAVLDMLKEGDIGVIDVSDGTTAHFSPN